MRRVLVIDDHDPSRRDLVGVLTQTGYEIVGEGTRGSGALALTLATRPDVILMAVGLSDLDGISVTRKIMEVAPLPIVLLTSHYDADTIEKAARAGVMGYLIKPLREGELRPAIEVAVAHFREFEALQKENESLKKTLEARKLIERAKGILMDTQKISEAEAFELIKRKSMDTRKPMIEIAQAIVLSSEVTKVASR